jgi:ATP-dependent Clp protease adapter protein ClpS
VPSCTRVQDIRFAAALQGFFGPYDVDPGGGRLWPPLTGSATRAPTRGASVARMKRLRNPGPPVPHSMRATDLRRGQAAVDHGGCPHGSCNLRLLALEGVHIQQPPQGWQICALRPTLREFHFDEGANLGSRIKRAAAPSVSQFCHECLEIFMAVTHHNNSSFDPMPTFSHSLEQSLQRALALASERSHEYATLEHLLLALIDDQDAAAVMRACNVDLDVLRRGLTADVVAEPKNPASDGHEDSKPTAAFHGVIQRAVIHVQTCGRDEVTGAHVLVAIFAEHESPAVHFLQEQGTTLYDATRYISHKVAKGVSHGDAGAKGPEGPGVSDRPPGSLAEVRLLNDDFTPMEFVVHVLERVFGKDNETATRIMLEIHDNGVGTCGIYPYEVADAKVRGVLSFAREHQHPLQCVLERSSACWP